MTACAWTDRPRGLACDHRSCVALRTRHGDPTAAPLIGQSVATSFPPEVARARACPFANGRGNCEATRCANAAGPINCALAPLRQDAIGSIFAQRQHVAYAGGYPPLLA